MRGDGTGDHRAAFFRARTPSSLASTKRLDESVPKASDLFLQEAVLPLQMLFGLPGPNELLLLFSQDVVHPAHLDELQAIQVQPLDVEPATRREPVESSVCGLRDVSLQVVNLGAKKTQALGRIRGGSVVSLEPIAGSTRVDEVADLVRTTGGLRVKVIDLQLTAHGHFGHAAIAATPSEGLPHCRASFDGDGHLRRREGGTHEPGKPFENRGAALLELSEEATCIGGERLLPREQPGLLLVLRLNSRDLAFLFQQVGSQVLHARRKRPSLLGLDLQHERLELRPLEVRQRANELLFTEMVQSLLMVVRPGHR